MSPMAGYKDFKDCVQQNRDKRNPEAYCAEIMRLVEGASKRRPKQKRGKR